MLAGERRGRTWVICLLAEIKSCMCECEEVPFNNTQTNPIPQALQSMENSFSRFFLIYRNRTSYWSSLCSSSS